MTAVLPLATVTSGKTIAYGLIGLFALALLGAIAFFAYSVWAQRKYSKVTLPSIEDEDETTTEDETVSAFALDGLDNKAELEAAYATSIDDEFAFRTIEAERRAEEAAAEEAAIAAAHEPEESLPMLDLEELTPQPAASVEPEAAPLPAAEEELTLPPPLAPVRLHLDEDEVDELPPHIPSAEVQSLMVEDRPQKTLEEIRREEEEDDDVPAPLAPQPGSSFSKLRMSGFDKMVERGTGGARVAEVPDFTDPAMESGPSYVGRRRREVPTDSSTESL